MKVYEAIISENATYRVYVEANNEEEAREKLDNRDERKEKCIDCSWEVDTITEIK